MKQFVLVGALIGALAGAAYAQGTATQGDKAATPARRAAGKAAQAGGHDAPKPQPNSAPAPSAPTGAMQLGTVHIPKGVKANGQALAAGTYQLRLTAQDATPAAAGETPSLERWVEFVQRGQVKGREVVTIIPQSEVKNVEKDTAPPPNGTKVQTLKGGDYVRIWINKGGNQYLLHLPTNG